MDDIIFEHGDHHCEPQPSAKDKWQAIKPVFVRLYITENKTLEVVRHELANEHGFEATSKALKYHIKLWKISKNYKAALNEALAQQEKLFLQSGQSDMIMSFNGRPVKWDRVRRHVRARAMNTSSHTTNQLSNVMSMRPLQSNFIKQPTLRADLLFGAAHNYLLSCVDLPELPAPTGFAPIECIGQIRFYGGSVLSYWDALDWCCERLRNDSGDVGFEVFWHLLNLNLWLTIFPDCEIATHLIGYFRQLAGQKLALNHPLQPFLQQLSADDTKHVIRNLVQCLSGRLDAIQEEVGSTTLAKNVELRLWVLPPSDLPSTVFSSIIPDQSSGGGARTIYLILERSLIDSSPPPEIDIDLLRQLAKLLRQDFLASEEGSCE